MKKFWAGLACGIVLSTATAVSASAPLKTILTQATIGLHVNGSNSLMEAGEVELLTYRDRIYVPLRWFSEKMGATVDYLPSDRGRTPQVDLFSEDGNNFNVSEETGSVSLAHVAVDFGDRMEPITRPPTITGVIRADKPIGEGMEAVLEIRDSKGNLIARSEYLKAGGRDDRYQTGSKGLSAFNAGEVRSFQTNFPFVDAIDDYRISVRIVEAEPWRYVQQGASYAQQESPFDIGLGSELGMGFVVKRGATFELTALFTNSTAKNLKITRAEFEVSMGSLWSHKLEPLADTVVPGHNGAMEISVPLKADFPPGEYVVELIPIGSVQYEEDGVSKSAWAGAGVFTNTLVPFTVS